MIQDKKDIALSCSILALILIFATGSIVFSQPTNTATLKGQVVHKQTKKGIPGLKVFLVSEVYGRSVLKVTDNDGYFTLRSIPVSEKNYYVEIYETDNLIYREELEVKDDMEKIFEVGK
jgi:hypothetical protein